MVWKFAYAYILGTMSILSPCTFILIPIMAADMKAKLSRTLFFLGGVITIYSILGLLVALTGKLLTNFMGSSLYLFAGVVTTIAGLDMLGWIELPKPKIFPRYQQRTPFVMGLMYGGVTLSCVGPLLAAILAFISTTTLLPGIIMMWLFSLGFITPFFLFGLLITDKKVAARIANHTGKVQKIGGFMLLLASLYLFYFGLRGVL